MDYLCVAFARFAKINKPMWGGLMNDLPRFIISNFQKQFNRFIPLEMIYLESPFLLYARCNGGATGIEFIDNRDTIDTFHPHK